MAKRKTNHNSQIAIFPTSTSDPLTNFLSLGGNIIVGAGAEWLSRELRDALGLSGVSTEKQIALNLSRLQLEKQQVETIKIRALSEMQLKYFELRIEQKQLEIEERKRRIEIAQTQQSQLNIPTITAVVTGALEVSATPEGLIDSGGQPEGYASWLDSFQSGKVIAILGKRGSGKSALSGKIAEYSMAVHRMPIYMVGLPEAARSLLPRWVNLTDSPAQCPVGCFIVIDEAGLQYLSLAFSTDRNRFLRALLMICRQRHCSLVFVAQSSRDTDLSILRQADTIIFKQPGLNQAESERDFLRPMARKAQLAFSEIPPDQRHESALVFDDEFQGIIKFALPSFWSEELSHVYAHFDLTSISQQASRRVELGATITEETKQLETASLEKNILELYRQGYGGIEKIAKAVGCSTWKVRQVLAQAEKEQR